MDSRLILLFRNHGLVNLLISLLFATRVKPIERIKILVLLEALLNRIFSFEGVLVIEELVLLCSINNFSIWRISGLRRY